MDLHLLQIGCVALGGSLGGVARFSLSGLVARRWGEAFPWGTLVVNVTGCALIGVLAALFMPGPDEPPVHPSLWLVLVTGILGSYTTVSSFSLQTMALLRAGETRLALTNVAASLGLCLLAAAAGLMATRIGIGS